MSVLCSSGQLSVLVVPVIWPYDDDRAGGVVDAVTADGPEDQVLEGTMAAGSHVDGTWRPYSLNLVVELPGLLAAVRSAGYEVNPVTYHLADWQAAPRRHVIGGRVVHLDGYHHHHVMQRIAYNHISLGIRPEQYTIVGHHLLAAVAEVLGDAVTPEVADAWSEVYWLFATQLIAEEARLYQQADVDPTHPVRPYRVIRRIEETHGVVSLVLEPADGGELSEICPGQYVSVFVDLPNGDRQPRQYTVSSNTSGTRLQITVSRLDGVDGAPDGQVSSFLHDHIVPGDLLDISAPAGDFFDQSSSAPILLASAGAGITTVLPIVEHIARTQPERPVIVAHADRTAQDHALRNTVLHVGRQIDDFTAYTWYETVEAGDRDSRPGRMDLSTVPLPEDVQVFTCGPFAVHAPGAIVVAGGGVPAVQIRYEVFGPDLWAAQMPPAPAPAS